MKLSPPKTITFIIGVGLGILALILQLLAPTAISSSYIVLLAVLGVAVLALGNLVKGL